jgi:biofilm PGA synthesis lipoprotein PgaB
MKILSMFLKLFILISIMLPLNSYASKSDCVLLVYHRFSDEEPKSTSTSPDLFKQHLEYLEENEYKVLPLKKVIESLKAKKDLPEKCVSLTADDGFLSFYTEAFPLLVRYQFPMSVFVSTESIDKNYDLMMSWSQLNDMTPLIDVYNHSTKHLHLVNQDTLTVENEISFAQERIAKELGTNDKFFAYPYGEFDNTTYSYLGSLGYVAFGQQSGVASQSSDFLNLPRFSMSGPYAKMDSFSLKVQTVHMPIKSDSPKSLIISNDYKPILDLVFSRPLTNYEKNNFSCFVSGQDVADLEWNSLQSVSVQSKAPLLTGRSRYNCTMPYKDKGRYYWYSKLWLRL